MSLTPWLAEQDPMASDWVQTFFEDPFFRRNLGAIVPRSTRMPSLKSVLNMDLLEKEHEYCLCADMPGFTKEDISVNIDNNVLTISANRTEKIDENNEKFHYHERNFGKVERSINLPSNANTDRATASYENGVLRLSFPKIVKGQAGKKLSIA